MSLEDFHGGVVGGGGGEKLEIRLNSALVEPEAWAELGNMRFSFSKSFYTSKQVTRVPSNSFPLSSTGLQVKYQLDLDFNFTL